MLTARSATVDADGHREAAQRAMRDGARRTGAVRFRLSAAGPRSGGIASDDHAACAVCLAGACRGLAAVARCRARSARPGSADRCRAQSGDADRRDEGSTASLRPCGQSADARWSSCMTGALRPECRRNPPTIKSSGMRTPSSKAQRVHRAHRHDVIDREQRIGPASLPAPNSRAPP